MRARVCVCVCVVRVCVCVVVDNETRRVARNYKIAWLHRLLDPNAALSLPFDAEPSTRGIQEYEVEFMALSRH